MRRTQRTHATTMRWVALLMALGLVVTACGGGSDDAPEPEAPSSDEPAPDQDPDDDAGDDGGDAAPVELDPVGPIAMGSIGIPPLIAMIAPYVALELGLYDKYNVDVSIRDMETGVDAARAVQGGDLDIAYSPTGPVMNFAATGVDVAAVFGLDNIDWLVGTTNPDIRDCEDLAGDTIGVDSVGGARYNVLQVILSDCGLTIDDVEVASFAGAPIQAIAAGQLDSAVLHIEDLYIIEEQGSEPMHVVKFLTDVDPLQHYLIFWTLRSSLDQNREAYVRLLAAQIEAIRFMNDPSNTERVNEIGLVTGVSPTVMEQTLPDVLAIEFWPIDRDGLTEDKMNAVLDTQVRIGNMEEADRPDYADVVDLTLYVDALELVNSMN